MLHKIVDDIVPLITVSYADVVAGLSMPMRMTINEVDKVFPVYYKDLETCQNDIIQNLVPDSSKRSIIYFETISQPTITQNNKFFDEFNATVRLVCWVNYKKINPNIQDVSVLVANILDVFPQKLNDIEFISSIRISLLEQVSKQDLFTQYTFNEQEHQFMTYPYDAFGLDYEITFRVARGCSSPITIIESC